MPTKTQTTRRTLLLACIALGGCQASGSGQARLDIRVPAQAAPEAFGSDRLQQGRDQLARGEIAAAIASFRNGLQQPETAVAALNGLGAAYAQLGRADLAERYFREAATRDPSDPRSARNLARLQSQGLPGTPRLAAGERAPDTAAAAAAAPVSLAKSFDAVFDRWTADGSRHLAAGVTLARVSARELRLTGPGEAGRAALGTIRHALVRLKPRQTMANGQPYPVRIEIGRQAIR